MTDHPGRGGPNYARLFAEAVRDSVRDYYTDNPAKIRPGWFLVQYRRGAPEIPARIVFIDHEPGDPENKLDTGPILVANIGFEEVDPIDVMVARGQEITEAKYAYAMALLVWQRDYDGAAPELSPTRRVDLLNLPPIGPPE